MGNRRTLLYNATDHKAPGTNGDRVYDELDRSEAELRAQLSTERRAD